MSCPTLPRSQSGFTLIEIAIVLVIIGLLLGGILKGQELINNARVKNLAADFRNIPVFIYGYQDKFRTLPGDDPIANTNLAGGITATTPSAPAARGNGLIEGAWNSATPTDETFLFWQHIRLAGLASGPTDVAAPDYRPRNSVGGELGVQSAAPITGILPSTYYICSSGILGKFVKQLDRQIDNGETNSGNMMASDTLPAPVDTSSIADSSLYTVCMGI